MRNKNKLIILILAAAVIIVVSLYGNVSQTLRYSVGFNRIKLTIPEQNNATTPEIAGGPEAENRTTEHNMPYPKALYYAGLPNKKQVALTFDDGPDIYYTTQILDILNKNNIKATFFIVGTRAQAHPEMVKRIANAGHAIGNHTWDHKKLTKLTPEQVRYEVIKGEQELYSILGFHPALFRPPYGATSQNNIRQIAAMGYKIIDWSVDTRDWAGTPVPQIMNYVKEEFHPGGIILEHCAGGKKEDLSNTVKALPRIISMLKEQKYTFIRVPELLGIPSTYKYIPTK